MEEPISSDQSPPLTHPEQPRDCGLEPTVGEQLRLAKALTLLDQANEAELRTIAKQMAHQVLVVHPCAIRYLAREAAQNLAGRPWDQAGSEQLIAWLRLGGGGAESKS